MADMQMRIHRFLPTHLGCLRIKPSRLPEAKNCLSISCLCVALPPPALGQQTTDYISYCVHVLCCPVCPIDPCLASFSPRGGASQRNKKKTRGQERRKKKEKRNEHAAVVCYRKGSFSVLAVHLIRFRPFLAVSGHVYLTRRNRPLPVCPSLPQPQISHSVAFAAPNGMAFSKHASPPSIPFPRA
jgi:hypothetical protein